MSKKLKSIKYGLSWNTLNLAFTKGITLITKLVLTSFLIPDDFGLISIAVISIGFVSTFSDFGLSSSLIQHKNAFKDRYLLHSAFWFLSIAGAIITIIFNMVIAPIISEFYDRNSLISIFHCLGLTILLNNLTVIPTAILSKRLLFKKLVIAELLSTFISCIVVTISALYGLGLYSLVLQILTQQIVKTALIFRVSRWAPRLYFSKNSLIQLKRFSYYTLANNASYYLRKNYDSLLIAKLLGTAQLGIYSIAFLLTETIRDQMLRLLNQVMYPIYSKIQDDHETIKSYYLLTIKFSTQLLFPISTLMVLYSEDVILHFNKIEAWHAAIPIIKILSFASMIFAMSASSSEVLRALGKPDVAFKISLWSTLFVSIPTVTLGVVYSGITGASWAVLISYIFQRYMFYKSIKHVISVNLKEILTASFTAIASTFAVFTINSFFSTKIPVILTLLIYMVCISASHHDHILNYIKRGLINNRRNSKLLSNQNVWLIIKKISVCYNSLIEIGAKKRIVFKTRSRFFKFYLWDQNGVIQKEIQASRSSASRILWVGLNPHFNHVRFTLGRFAIFSSKKIFLGTETLSSKDIDSLKVLLHNNAASLGETISWIDTLPEQLANLLHESSYRHIYEVLDKNLSEIKLPKTSSHGDLLPRNISKTKDMAFSIFDWETFRENGSYFEDIATLTVSYARGQDFQPGKDIGTAISRGFNSVYNLTQVQTLLLYSINRMYVEWLITNLSDKQLKENLQTRVVEATKNHKL